MRYKFIFLFGILLVGFFASVMIVSAGDLPTCGKTIKSVEFPVIIDPSAIYGCDHVCTGGDIASEAYWSYNESHSHYSYESPPPMSRDEFCAKFCSTFELDGFYVYQGNRGYLGYRCFWDDSRKRCSSFAPSTADMNFCLPKYCTGVFNNPPYGGENTGCCGGSAYNRNINSCCQNIGGLKVDSVYNHNTQKCCYMDDHPLATMIIDKPNDACCGGSGSVQQYNSDTQGCCGGKLFDLHTHGCCSDQIYDITPQGTKHCCSLSGLISYHEVLLDNKDSCSTLDSYHPGMTPGHWNDVKSKNQQTLGALDFGDPDSLDVTIAVGDWTNA
jgi:hypothetical protein